MKQNPFMLILSDVAPPTTVKEKVMISVISAVKLAKLLAVKETAIDEDDFD
ncbi:MAG: hypothetical protein R2809_05635 [Flavobacteriales bacterium]